jgi:hypothetical protein
MSEEQRVFDDFVLLERTKCNIEKMEIDSLVDIFCFCINTIGKERIKNNNKIQKVAKELFN